MTSLGENVPALPLITLTAYTPPALHARGYPVQVQAHAERCRSLSQHTKAVLDSPRSFVHGPDPHPHVQIQCPEMSPLAVHSPHTTRRPRSRTGAAAARRRRLIGGKPTHDHSLTPHLLPIANNLRRKERNAPYSEKSLRDNVPCGHGTGTDGLTGDSERGGTCIYGERATTVFDDERGGAV
ncbi:hypothetical protein BJV78DRAFT_1193209 [Lactifluus subvellereus]|nr:hypothetical protein BJV78DRAFT_1193209 [Lactifluus subvellereus]